MPGTNIKQAEAAERSGVIKVSSYRIDLDLTTGAENFRVKTTVAFAGLKPGATTYIDCVGSKVISAKPMGASRFSGYQPMLPNPFGMLGNPQSHVGAASERRCHRPVKQKNCTRS